MSIASEISRLQTAKSDIKAAIEAKGVTVPSNATIDTYDYYVSQISGGGGGGMVRYTSGTPYCNSTNLVVRVQNEISIDSGTSWVNSGSPYVVIVESGASQCQSILPAGYTEVEYIQNTGTSYLELNFVPNQDTRIVADMQMVSSNEYPRLFGAGAWNEANGLNVDYENGYLQVSWFGNTSWTAYSNVPTNFDRKLYDLNKNYLYVDETLVGSSTYVTKTASDNLGVFTYISNGRPASSDSFLLMECFKGKLYSFKVYNNGTLSIDIIPCIRDNDSTVGAYDIVNDVFYTVPSGYTTDKLVAGNPV